MDTSFAERPLDPGTVLASAPTPRERCAGLSAVPSTLRIPLAARAFGDALFPRVAVGDAHAASALAAMGDDGRQWLQDLPTVYGILARTRRFRRLAAEFLASRPDGHVVNLGCGLSQYFQWLDNGRARMTDADLPEVLSLRRELLPAMGERHVQAELDLGAPDWWDRLELPASRAGAPLFLLCEGVLMYLRPEAVQRVMRTFGERAPAGSVFAFDAMCWLAAGRADYHPSVRRTRAEFHWGLRRPGDLARSHPRLRLVETCPVMEDYGFPYVFAGPAFRLLFGVPAYAVYALLADDARA